MTSFHINMCPNDNPLNVTFQIAASKHKGGRGTARLSHGPWSYDPSRGMGLETGMHGLGVIAPSTGIMCVHHDQVLGEW